MGRFQFGQIVLAYINDGRGRTKDRPALIISRDEENDRGEDLQVVAITTKGQDPRHYHVSLYDDNGPDPSTDLTEPCVAKCNWVRDVPQHKVIKSLGYMPYELLESILNKFNEIMDDETFDEWT